MLVALSVDRAIAVWVPITYFQKSKPIYALIVSVTIPIVAMALSAPTAFSGDITVRKLIKL